MNALKTRNNFATIHDVWNHVLKRGKTADGYETRCVQTGKTTSLWQVKYGGEWMTGAEMAPILGISTNATVRRISRGYGLQCANRNRATWKGVTRTVRTWYAASCRTMGIEPSEDHYRAFREIYARNLTPENTSDQTVGATFREWFAFNGRQIDHYDL